jgi:hypothetical protein
MHQQTKDMNMTNALAVIPTFSAADIKACRAWALAYGEPTISARGKLPMWILLDWHRNLRPTVVAPESDPKGGSPKFGRRTRVVLKNGTEVEVGREDARAARRWAIAEGFHVPVKGRLNAGILQSWVNEGMPIVAGPRVEKATVYYVKKNYVTGELYSKLHAITVYADMLPIGKGRPPMYTYVRAVQKDMPKHAVPVRITTPGTIVDVTVGDDGEYRYAWVSKADSKTVVDMIKGHISL